MSMPFPNDKIQEAAQRAARNLSEQLGTEIKPSACSTKHAYGGATYMVQMASLLNPDRPVAAIFVDVHGAHTGTTPLRFAYTLINASCSARLPLAYRPEDALPSLTREPSPASEIDLEPVCGLLASIAEGNLARAGEFCLNLALPQVARSPDLLQHTVSLLVSRNRAEEGAQLVRELGNEYADTADLAGIVVCRRLAGTYYANDPEIQAADRRFARYEARFGDLRQCPIFSNTPPELFRCPAEQCEIRIGDGRTPIFEKGDTRPGLAVVLSGHLLVYTGARPEGRPDRVRLPGDIVGEGAEVSRRRSHIGADLASPERSAWVIPSDGARVVMFCEGCVERLFGQRDLRTDLTHLAMMRAQDGYYAHASWTHVPGRGRPTQAIRDALIEATRGPRHYAAHESVVGYRKSLGDQFFWVLRGCLVETRYEAGRVTETLLTPGDVYGLDEVVAGVDGGLVREVTAAEDAVIYPVAASADVHAWFRGRW